MPLPREKAWHELPAGATRNEIVRSQRENDTEQGWDGNDIYRTVHELPAGQPDRVDVVIDPYKG